MRNKCPLCGKEGRNKGDLGRGGAEFTVFECSYEKCRVESFKYEPHNNDTYVFSRHDHECEDWSTEHGRCI